MDVSRYVASALYVAPSGLGPDGVPIGAAAWLLEQVSVVSARGLRPLVTPRSQVVQPGAENTVTGPVTA